MEPKPFKGAKPARIKYRRAKQELVEKIEKRIEGYKIAGDDKSEKLKAQLEKVQNGLKIPNEITEEYLRIRDILYDYESIAGNIRYDITIDVKWLLGWDLEPRELVSAYATLKDKLKKLELSKTAALKDYEPFNRGMDVTPTIERIIQKKSARYDPKIMELKGAIHDARKIINQEVEKQLPKKRIKAFQKAGFPVRREKIICKSSYIKYSMEIEILVPDKNYRHLNEQAYDKLLKLHSQGLEKVLRNDRRRSFRRY